MFKIVIHVDYSQCLCIKYQPAEFKKNVIDLLLWYISRNAFEHLAIFQSCT